MKRSLFVALLVLVQYLSFAQGGTLKLPIGAKADTGTITQGADYVIDKVGTTYYARPRYRSALTMFTGTNAATVVNNAIAALSAGGTMIFAKGDYTISSSIVDAGVGNISLMFNKGAKLIAADSLNAPVVYLTNVAHWRIDGVEVDGNNTKQRTPILAGGTYPDGIWVSTGNDVIISNAYIHHARRFGANFDETSQSSGIINSSVSYCFWNGVNLGNSANDQDLFAMNNDISHCSDVALANYGTSCKVIGNTIRDMDQTGGYNGTEWDGISIEGGGANIISNNRIYNVNNGVLVISSWKKNSITDNKFYNWDRAQTFNCAIFLYSDSNHVANNTMYSARSIGYGIKFDGSDNNSIQGNKINCPIPLRLGNVSSNNFITNNTLQSFGGGNVPININDANCLNNRIIDNDMGGSNAAMTNSGTGTIIGDNVWFDGNYRLATVTSAQMITAVGDETGSGVLVFNNAPSFTAPTIGGVAIPSISSVSTLTNKRITLRIGTTASSATPTPDADSHDQYTITALAVNATFGAPTGTPTDGQQLMIRAKDNGTARTLAWNAIYRASTDIALPLTTVLGKTLYMQFIYNSADTKWDFLGYTQGF